MDLPQLVVSTTELYTFTPSNADMNAIDVNAMTVFMFSPLRNGRARSRRPFTHPIQCDSPTVTCVMVPRGLPSASISLISPGDHSTDVQLRCGPFSQLMQ